MDQTSATSPTTAPQQPSDGAPSDGATPVDDGGAHASPPGFGARGRVRRRARYLRKARELAYRDLGGLVYSLHRFGQRNDPLVLAKLATLGRIDAELRALEASLAERQPVTVLREAGITACPRCAAIHSGEDRFCPNCGLPLSRRSDLPIAGAAAPATAPAAAPPAAQPAMPAPRPAAPAATTPAATTPPATTPAATPAPTGGTAMPATGAPGAPGAPTAPASAGAAPPEHAPAAAPAHAPALPATQAHDTVGAHAPGAGDGPGREPTRSGEDDQPTEIIRPRPSRS